MSMILDTSSKEEQEISCPNFIKSPFEPSLEQKMDGDDMENRLVKTSPESCTSDPMYHKRRCILGEEERLNPFQDKTLESHYYMNYRSSSMVDHAAESKSLKGNYDKRQSSSQSRDASHSIRQDLLANSGDASDYLKHNDHLDSSSDEITPSSNRKRRELESQNQTTGLGEGYHRSSRLIRHPAESQNRGVESSLSRNYSSHNDDRPSSSQATDASQVTGHDIVSKSRDEYKHDDHTGSNSRLLRHVPLLRKNNRYTNTYTNEGSLQSRGAQQDEIAMTGASRATRRVERDDEAYDICSVLNSSASIDLFPPPQSNETYKWIQNLMPGMFLLKKWLTEHEQVALVKRCQKLGLGRGGFFRPCFGDGKKMRLRMMCLGMNWNHETHKYEATRAHDDAQPPSIPPDFIGLVSRAIEDSREELRKDHNVRTQEELIEALPGLDPDVCIVNFYEESGRLGLHQDKDESPASLAKGLPVVSFSVGDTAEFCYGKDRNFENLNKIELESGDVLIFGGKSRLVFHSVPCLYPGTAPNWLIQNTLLRPGRLNLTFRQISV